jgi:hypothetical protein
MASVTITLTDICAGGEHLTYEVTGAASRTVPGNLGDTLEPVTEEEAVAFVKVIAKLAKAGRNLNQAKTIMQNGVTVTV